MTSRERQPFGKALERPSSDAAKDRLAAALRENLKRRKVQKRAHSDRDAQEKEPPKSDKDPSP